MFLKVHLYLLVYNHTVISNELYFEIQYLDGWIIITFLEVARVTLHMPIKRIREERVNACLRIYATLFYFLNEQ